MRALVGARGRARSENISRREPPTAHRLQPSHTLNVLPYNDAPEAPNNQSKLNGESRTPNATDISASTKRYDYKLRDIPETLHLNRRKRVYTNTDRCFCTVPYQRRRWCSFLHDFLFFLTLFGRQRRTFIFRRPFARSLCTNNADGPRRNLHFGFCLFPNLRVRFLRDAPSTKASSCAQARFCEPIFFLPRRCFLRGKRGRKKGKFASSLA